MFGAARYEQVGAADDSGEHTADECARMTAGLDVAVVPHDVTRPSDRPAARRLGLGEDRQDARGLRFVQLARDRYFECAQHADHARQIDRVAHDTMSDDIVARHAALLPSTMISLCKSS